MTRDDAGGVDASPDWPVEWSGVVESVVTTLGPNDRWNVAALGLHAPDHHDAGDGLVHARTWGRTRTRRNFEARGGGAVQFTRDPVDFVEAACAVREEDHAVLSSAEAWVRVEVDRVASGTEDGTEWVEWALTPVAVGVDRRVVPTTDRAHAAIVEATVAASRIDVPGYDADALRDRIAYFEDVVDSCGGERHREAWERFEELVE